MNQLKSMRIFVNVVAAGSFTAAATELGMSRAKVSAHISELERHLGVLLLNRTTRSLALTHDGTTYHAHCQRVLTEIDDTELLLKASQANPQGRLTIDANSGFSHGVLLSLIRKFLVKYPDVHIELCNTGHIWDVTAGQSDILIRIGPITDSSLIAKTIYHRRLMTAASPEYIARHGQPNTPGDLAAHTCLGYMDPVTGREINEWTYLDGAGVRKVGIGNRLTVNDGMVYVAAMLQGFGIGHGQAYMFEPYLRSGELVQVLRDWEVMGEPVVALFHRSKELALRVRTFVDFVVAEGAVLAETTTQGRLTAVS